MGKHRYTCASCSTSFPMSELHIDPNTSEWYCDPCWNVLTAERGWQGDSDGSDESFDTEDGSEDDDSDTDVV